MDDARRAIRATDWAALEHAYGRAKDVPKALRALLSEKPKRCGNALAFLDSVVLHQGSLYPATAPAAMFVAGILDDPRTMITCESDLPWDDRKRPVRAALLDWLGEVARSASDWDDGAGEPDEFEDEREAAEQAEVAARCQAIRGDLYHAVSPFVDDPNDGVRAAAASALGHLLLAPELVAFRNDAARRLIRSVEGMAATERAAVALILDSWGEAPHTFLVDRDPAVRAAAASATCFDADPRALAEVRLALADPERADGWFPDGVPHVEGRFRFALVRALLRRTREFDEVIAEAVAVADMTTDHAVDGDWGHLLERAFPRKYRAGEPLTTAQHRFLIAIVRNDRCWGSSGSTFPWFHQAGLPHDRASLRALVR